MNIYLVKRPDSPGWDEYDSFVVICESPEIAKGCHPNGWEYSKDEAEFYSSEWARSWVSPNNVTVMYIGRCDLTAGEFLELPKVDDDRIEAYVINSSFNAG